MYPLKTVHYAVLCNMNYTCWIGACLETPPNSNYSRKQFRSCYGLFSKSEFKMSLLKASKWIWLNILVPVLSEFINLEG